MTLEELFSSVARANRGALTICPDQSSYLVHRWGLQRFKSLPELSKFVAEINGGGPFVVQDLSCPRPNQTEQGCSTEQGGS
jgi:hypothetical protein